MLSKSTGFREMERFFVKRQGKAAADAIKSINRSLYKDLIISYYNCPPGIVHNLSEVDDNNAASQIFPGDD